jgi:hypothetical protein
MKYIFVIALVVAVLFAGWQVLEPEITNVMLQDELHDMSLQPAWRPGMSAPSSDEELRLAVIRGAARHDITLDPKQITVRRIGQGETQQIYIAVDYTVPVNLLVRSFELHFNPSSTGGRF